MILRRRVTTGCTESEITKPFPLARQSRRKGFLFNTAVSLAFIGCAIVLAATTSAAAQQITTTLSVGSGPDALAVNPVTNKVYVASKGSNTVTVVDGASNATTSVVVG